MKKLQITAPEGFEIDQEKSNLSKGIVHFKEIKKNLSYEDVAQKLFKTGLIFYSDSDGGIRDTPNYFNNKNNSKTIEQISSIIALNQLCNVAKYLNGDWLPDFSNQSLNFSLVINFNKNIEVTWTPSCNYGRIFFKTQEIALQAIEILGEYTIRKALTLNH